MKPVALRLLILALAIAVGAAVAPAVLGGKADAPAPDFSVTTLDGETFHLSEHRGDVVVIDFFATWCASCKITEGQLRDARAGWDERVQIISIDVDPFETDSEVRSYRNSVQIPWPVARDTDSVAQRYGVFELGRVIVVDAQGRVVSDEVGIVEADTLRAAVSGALSGDAGGISLPRPGLLAVGAAAGAASFFSPCCAPMLPAYLAMGVPRTGEHSSALLTRRLREGSATAVGLLVVYVSLGAALFLAGSFVRGAIPYFQAVTGVALVGIGAFALTRPAAFDRASAFLSGLGGGADMTKARTWRA
ncbi:MAG: redoxin domain-containing protein, partial [Candidatus Thermoplasmatota archaeon]